MKASNIFSKIVLPLFLLMFCFAANAEKYKGKIGNKYDIVFYENYQDENNITGKYAYTSTLKKNGNQKSSYLYFTGYQTYEPEYPFGVIHLTVTDSKGNLVERWTLYPHENHGHAWMEGTIYFVSGPSAGKKMSVDIDLGSIY